MLRCSYLIGIAGSGHTEYKHAPPTPDIIEYLASHDSDLARDLRDRRSVSSSVHEINGVAIDWECRKQKNVAEHSNGSEIRALYIGVRKTFCIRNFLLSIGHRLQHPTPMFEDNLATISQVLHNRIAPQARPIDVLVTGLNEHYLRGTYAISHTKTDKMLANFNTKPMAGDNLQQPVMWTVGHRFYPTLATNPTHYKLLQLHIYPIAEPHDTQ